MEHLSRDWGLHVELFVASAVRPQMKTELENEETSRILKKPEDWGSLPPERPEGRSIGLVKLVPFSSLN